MYDPIENPVAEHAEAYNPCFSPVVPRGEVAEDYRNRPSNRPKQAVRNGVIVEIKGCDPGVSRRDADVFEADEQKDGPNEVQEYRGKDEGAERSLRGEAFGGEGRAYVADEHV